MYTPKINPKSVNLELKTVLEFNDKDKESDIKLLDEIQNVITEIRTIINKNHNNTNFRRNSRDKALTDFIQKAVNIINTYEDKAFDDFFNILHNEIRNYHYKGCKFYELMENHEIKKLITAKLDSIKGRPTYFKKTKINGLSDVFKYENYDSNVEKIVDYINSLYTQAGHKFRRLLSSLERYGKSKSRRSYSHLVNIIKNGLRSIIFDHYTNLSMNTRQQLKHKIEVFLKRYKKNHRSKIGNVAKVTPYNTKNSKNEAKNLEADPGKYQININNKTTKLNRIKIKQSEHKNKMTKKDDLNNEIKRQKNTRKETIVESFEIQEKETKQTSRNTDFAVQQWFEIKDQGQTGNRDSLSASFSSIEFLTDQQNNTQQFLARVLHKNTQKSKNVTNKQEVIDTLNARTKTPTNNTTQKKVLWIEQSTGKLPKAVLDRLVNKTSRSNPKLTGSLNKKGHKYKYQKRWHRKVNKPDKTRRKGTKPETAKKHKKIYDPQNHKALRYSELKRDKTNGKIYHQDNYKKYELADDKTRGNVKEPENDDTPGSIYESEIEKLHGKIYELENDIAEDKIYDSRHKSKDTTKHRFEFNYKNELKEDKYKYEKKLKRKKPTNIKRYEREHGQTQKKVLKPIYDETVGKIYESNEDMMNANILYDKDNTKSAKKQLMHDSKENKKHKPYNTSKPKDPTIVKHNHRYMFNQNDVRTTNSLFNKKDEKVHQNKKTKGLLRVDLKHDKRPIRCTVGFPQVLDGQILSKPGKTIKHLAKGTATMKVPNSSRPPRLQFNDIARMKSHHQTSPLSYSSIERLYVPLPLEAYSKSNNKWSKKRNRHLKITTEYSLPLKEDITLGNIEITDDNAQTTSSSFKKDSYGNKTIKNLERHLDEGISRANVNTKEGRKLKHRFEVKSNVVKPTQIETMAPYDDTLWQDTLKMAETADNKADILIDYVTDKHSKIKDNDAVGGITQPENRFKSGINMIPVDFKVKDKLKIVETAVNKTEFSIEDYKDTYAENKIENGKKSEFNSGFERIPVDKMVRLNMTGTAKKEKAFLNEHVVDKASKYSENKIENAKTFQTVTQNKLKKAETAFNKFEPIIENNYTKGNSTNHDLKGILNKGNMSSTGFRADSNMIHKDFDDMTTKAEITGTADNLTEYVIEQNKDDYIEDIINKENGKKPDINMIPYDYNDKTDQTNPRTVDINTEFNENENDFKIKEDIFDKDHQIYVVDDQTSVGPEAPKEIHQIDKAIKHQDINDVTFQAKHRDMKDQVGDTLTNNSEITVIMNDQKDHDNYNDKTDQTNPTTADINREFNEKENDFKSKEDIFDKDHQIYVVDDQNSVIPETPKEIHQIDKAIKQQDINDVTFQAKNRAMKVQDDDTLTNNSEITVIMNDQKDQDNYNDKTDQTNPTTADINTEFNEKENDFKSKEEIFNKGHQIYVVDDQTSVIPKAPKEIHQIDKVIKQQDINDVTFQANHRDMKDQVGATLTNDSEITVIMNDQKDQDFLNYDEDDVSKRTEIPTTNIAATNLSMKSTESTTNASATTIVAALTTPNITVPALIPVVTWAVTTSKALDVWQKAELNATVNKKNKMADTLPEVDVTTILNVSQTNIDEVKSKVNTNMTNVLREVTPTTL